MILSMMKIAWLRNLANLGDLLLVFKNRRLRHSISFMDFLTWCGLQVLSDSCDKVGERHSLI